MPSISFSAARSSARISVGGMWSAHGDDPDDWKAAGLCAQTDPDIFFPERGEPCDAAKKICGRCPVREECLRYSFENDEHHGIWGGLSERQRRAMRRAMHDDDQAAAA